jgi:transposase InsO family protein
MSKRRSIILAVTVEGRTHAEVAAQYGVSRSWVTRLVGRYRTEGDAAFEPRSRRPRTSPTKVSDVLNQKIMNLRVDLTSRGLDAGPHTIQWHLANAGHTVSVSTIRRRLIAAGLITPEPKKRPKSSYIRFEADLPNETWQSDFTHFRLTTGADTEILVWLDDHSRYALDVTAHNRVTGTLVVDTFDRTASKQGFPASVLTDNGMVYTTRFAGYRGGRNALETRLVELGVEHKHSRPNHPTTCGKVERFHQTLKKWLTAQAPQPTTIDELQALTDAFVEEYNHRRPHRSLGRATPAVAYNRLPKTGPAGSTAGPHYRIRHDRIDDTGSVSLRRAGRMHHIGIGRAHKHTPVILLIDDLDIRVINTDTGELLRALTLDPTRGYQPRFKT